MYRRSRSLSKANHFQSKRAHVLEERHAETEIEIAINVSNWVPLHPPSLELFREATRKEDGGDRALIYR